MPLSDLLFRENTEMPLQETFLSEECEACLSNIHYKQPHVDRLLYNPLGRALAINQSKRTFWLFMLSLPSKIATLIIRLYQITFSLVFPASCRFSPTCSNYSIEALYRHGFIRGIKMSFFRIIRCHPFSKNNSWDPLS